MLKMGKSIIFSFTKMLTVLPIRATDKSIQLNQIVIHDVIELVFVPEIKHGI